MYDVTIEYNGSDVHAGLFDTLDGIAEKISELIADRGGDMPDYSVRFLVKVPF